MALAVAEAQRVLRPGGRLVEIHPQGLPLRLEIWRARRSAPPENRTPDDFDRQVLGDLAPEEMTEDFAAATRAIAGAAGGSLEHGQTIHFDYRYFFETLDELTAYLEDNEELQLASDALLEQALLAMRETSTRAQLVLIQPVIVTQLHKPGP
jgi:hypothetical protein